MQKFIFKNVKIEYFDCECCKGMKSPATTVSEGPFEIMAPVGIKPENIVNEFFGEPGRVVEYECQIV
jgi:hypothetical protein